MKKEQIKSLVLVLLVLTNLVLADKILVNKKLWPSGYNFFANTGKHKKNTVSVAESLTAPEKIIVNTGYQSSRFEYKRSDSNFNAIAASAGELIKRAFSASSKMIQTVTADEWYSVLTAKSIYLSYPTGYSGQNFAEFIGVSQTELSLDSFSDIAISEAGNVYIADKNNYYRIAVTSDKISPIITEVMSEHLDEDSVINYSFDLNFDKDFGEQRTFLSPMIPIYSEPISSPIQLSTNPILKSDGNISPRAIDGILTSFSINTGTVRRYTEADGSHVFVENNGILKISPDGILSFKANVTGIKLNSGTSSVYSDISALGSFIDKLNSALDIDSDMLITSPMNESNIKTVTLDYLASGFPVKYSDKSAVKVTISNGYITEYTQILRKYTPTNHFEQSSVYIEALDSITSKYQNAMKDITITDMFPAYMDNMSTGEKALDWYIEIDNIIVQ